MTWIHILTGLLAIAAGTIAMTARKGSTLHRRSGNVFTISMLLMTGSAAVVAFFLRIDHVTAVVAVATAYLVLTARLAVKRTVPQSFTLLLGLALVSAVLGVHALQLWFHFIDEPKSLITKNSPPQTLLVFGILSLLCALSDVRVLWAGQLSGTVRLVRHLWRMCVAMLIATGSFFAGQMQVFPLTVQKTTLLGWPILVLPVLLVLLATLYWLVRTSVGRNRSHST